MYNLAILEDWYQQFVKDIRDWLPEDILNVDLRLLQKFDLLDFHDREKRDPALTQYFHVVETTEKITLVNDDFVVWIVPEKFNDISLTYTLIAMHQKDHPHLELAFVTTGAYNTSRIVLRVLEKFLFEIRENEELIKKLQ